MGFVEFLNATLRPSQTRERPPFRPMDDRGDQGGSTETATGEVTVECLAVHREIYTKERAAVKACVQTAKRRFYCEKIHSSSSSRQLFAVSSELLGKSSTAPLPSDIPRSDLPDRSSDFFSDKTDLIRDDQDSRSREPQTFAIFDRPLLSQFEPVTVKPIRELILRSPTKGCCHNVFPNLSLKRKDGTIDPFLELARMEEIHIHSTTVKVTIFTVLFTRNAGTNDCVH